MAPLHKIWDNLPGGASGVTNVFTNQTGVYSAVDGYVYRHDFWTGERLQTGILLHTTGSAEVRLTALLDGSMLIAGTNGYVVGLDPITLASKWTQDLKGSGYHETSVSCTKDSVYAGCNGLVLRLDPSNGHELCRNELKGYGYHEVRLDLTFSQKILLVGINGYALGLDAIDLKDKWSYDLPGSGYDITTVLGGANVCYAGCKGMVFRLDESSGIKLQDNNLPGAGKGEVRMAMDADGSELYVGTNGYAIGLHPDNLGTEYFKSLESSGYNVTDVVAGARSAFFGTNGYVYELDLKGNQIGHNPLSGFGKGRTSLAVDRHAAGQLFVGLIGRTIALGLSDQILSYGPWMSQLAPRIEDKMLREIAIPGSHDSGTYGIHWYSHHGKDCDEFPWYVWIWDKFSWTDLMKRSITKSWAVSQPLDFYHQLTSGIRYFDIRLQANGSLAFVHGLVGSPVTELFDQVNAFLSQPGNEREIILLDLNHFYGFDDQAHDVFAATLLQTFGMKLAPASLGPDVKLKDCWNSGYQIIIFYGHDATAHKGSFLWPSNSIDSPWPNKIDSEDVYSYLNSLLPNSKPKFFVLQGIVTPDGGSIAAGLNPFSNNPNSLLTFACDINSKLVTWLKQWKGKGINIVICDWTTWNPGYVDTVVKLNI